MFFDLTTAIEGEWFSFQNSKLDPMTNEPVFDEPINDAKVQIRSMVPFFEERIANRKQQIDNIYNPKTRSMQRTPFIPELTPDEVKKERDDAYDYAITGLLNFKDSKTGEVISCTRENKLILMRVPVFNRFFEKCQQELAATGVKEKEDEAKNS